MNKIKSITAAVILLSQVGICGIFDHIDWGARVVGIGYGYVGSAYADSSIVLWNPAGAVGVDSVNELAGMYGMPFMGLGSGIDLRYSMISFVRKLDTTQAVGVGLGMFDVSGVWLEGEYVVSYSRGLSDKLSLGLSIKYLEYKVKLNPAEYGDDPLLSKGGKGVISGDIGCVYKLSGNMNVGLVLNDVMSPEISLEGQEKLEMGYMVGLNYVAGKDVKMVYSLGYYGRGSDSGYSLGCEAWLSGGKVAVRGSLSDVRYALGASYNLDKIRVDYTYAIPSQLSDTQGSHYVGLVFRF